MQASQPGRPVVTLSGGRSRPVADGDPHWQVETSCADSDDDSDESGSPEVGASAAALVSCAARIADASAQSSSTATWSRSLHDFQNR